MPAIDTCLMKKVVIPTILAATILVAGMFAMMPVQKAATVHSSIGQLTILELADADSDAADVYTLDCTANAIVYGLYVGTTGPDGTYTDSDLTIAGAGFDEQGFAVNVVLAAAGNNLLTAGVNVPLAAAETLTLTAGAETDGGDEAITITASVTTGGTCTLV